MTRAKLAGTGCTAYVDTLTGEIRSNLSWGEAGSIVSAGGRTSTFSKLATSVWSRTVDRLARRPVQAGQPHRGGVHPEHAADVQHVLDLALGVRET